MNNYVTFGSFNNLAKVNDRLIALWSCILGRVPGSRVLLKAASLRDPSARLGVIEAFARHGICADRILLLSPIDGTGNHLAAYAQVDIALDTLPYHGTTTTCEALWMGVPVVTLAGQTHVSRVGASLLRQVSLTDLIAETPDDYVDRAVQLAEDHARLADLRRVLRGRMSLSQLTSGAVFTRDFESTIRSIWRV